MDAGSVSCRVQALMLADTSVGKLATAAADEVLVVLDERTARCVCAPPLLGGGHRAAGGC